MKALTYVFGAGVVGVVVCFVMTIVTGIQENRAKTPENPAAIPVPALGQ